MQPKRYGLNSPYAWFIWGLGAAFFLVEYPARLAPSIMVPELMSTFGLNATSVGAFSALFYHAYVGMQIPVGALMDRYGPHTLLTITALLCATGCFMYAFAESLIIAQVGRFLTGFGAAFAFVGTLKLATLWFTPYRFGLLAGATQALGMLGASFGQGPTAFLMASVGWRNTLLIIGLMLLVLALMIGVFVRDRDVLISKQTDTPNPDKNHEPLWPALFTVFKNPQTWLVSLFAGLLYAPTAAFAEFWGATYLTNVYSMSREVAASAISLVFIGWAVGGPIAGAISDRLERRKPIMFASSVACFIAMTIVLYFPKSISHSMLFVLLFVYGVSNVGVATAYAVSCELNVRRVSGTAMAVCNMMSVLVGSAFQPIIGKILDVQWQGELVEGVRQFSVAAYQQAMILLPLCFIICFFITFAVRETYCRPIE